MKLYTEEQVNKVWKAGQKYWETSGASTTLEELLEQLTPIELPSDEEIKTYLNNHSYEFEHGFKDAIEFIKNKIQGGQL